MALKVECHSETATSRSPATVKVFEDGKLIEEVIATVEHEKGADGDFYPVIKLSKMS